MATYVACRKSQYIVGMYIATLTVRVVMMYVVGLSHHIQYCSDIVCLQKKTL